MRLDPLTEEKTAKEIARTNCKTVLNKGRKGYGFHLFLRMGSFDLARIAAALFPEAAGCTH